MADLRFAVLGTGFWANYQIPAWFEVGGVKLVALYNRTVSKAQRVAERYGIPRVYADAEELFRREELDFVDIVTEVPAHAPLVLLAAKHRVPVICQKPMGPDYDTCRTMVEACTTAGVPFMIHENFRWQAPVRALKKALMEGAIGDPFRASIRFVHGLPMIFENQPLLKTLEHFALTDVGSHLLDLARFLFGEPHHLFCQTHKSRLDIAGEDIASVIMRIGEMICSCDISYSSITPMQHFPETFIFVEGKKGTLDLRPDYWLSVTTEGGTLSKRVPPPHYPWADPAYEVVHASLVPCITDLLNALKTGMQAETSGADNLKTMQLVFSAYDSASRNAVVNLDER